MAFEVRFTQEGAPVFKIQGCLDSEASEWLVDCLDSKPGEAGLDLSEVTSVDFSGAVCLLNLRRHGKVSVLKGSKPVDRFLHLMRPVLVSLIAA
jgi:hypothetical protein